MSIPTPQSLKRQNRRLDRRNARAERDRQRVEQIVERIRRRGLVVHCYYTFGKPTFVLSDGTRIPGGVGYALTKHPNLVAVDPPLFVDGLPQTFRYAESCLKSFSYNSTSQTQRRWQWQTTRN
jgi:hypothetical protein